MSDFKENIRKKAWPWGGEGESQRGDYRDVETGVQSYDLLSPVKYTSTENQIPEYSTSEFAEGSIEDFDEMLRTEEISLGDMIKSLSSISVGIPSIALVGVNSAPIRERLGSGANIYSAYYEDSINKTAYDSVSMNGSPMFCRFPERINLFVVNAEDRSSESVIITLENIKSQLSVASSGVLIYNKNIKIKNTLKKIGFSVKSRKIGENNVYYLKANDLSNIALARIYRKGKDIASFLCDVAETPEKKRDGLQIFSSLKKQCGLLFPYKRATDVMFHMGSVSFPIDIIFIEKNGRIKKISNNIKPGSLEVFACSGTQNVLEVAGGTCNLLDIKEGDNLFLTYADSCRSEITRLADFSDKLSIEKIAYKNTNTTEPKLYKVANKSIVGTNRGRLPDSSGLYNTAWTKDNVVALDLDSISKSAGKVRLYASRAPDYEDRVYQSMLGDSMSVDLKDFVDVPAALIFSKQGLNKLSRYSYVNGLSCRSFDDNIKGIIKKASQAKYTDIVYVSRGRINKAATDAIFESFLKDRISISQRSKSMIVPTDFGTEQAYDASMQRYGAKELFATEILKQSGIPVPDKTKKTAKSTLKHIADAIDLSKKLSDNLERNLQAYESVKDKPEVISSSLGKYNQSCKRNSRIAKRMLLNVKSSIEHLNSIKDVSSTGEIIGSAAGSAKVCSDEIKKILDLTAQIESGPFFERLSEYTPKAVSALEDLALTMNRAKDYINSDILGILILTE